MSPGSALPALAAIPHPEPPGGSQWLLDLHGCATPHLDDLDWVRRIMLEAAARAEARVAAERFHRFEPHGISGFVLIAEAHLAVHIWPERRFAAIDIFTCNESLSADCAANFLIEAFGAKDPRIMSLPRGAPDANGWEEASADVPELGGPQDELHIDRDDGAGGHWFVRIRTLVSCKTEFQNVEIVEFAELGKALLLDTALQSVEADEHIYHEALVQPALCLHPCPRRVLIVGGGEGATLRETLKHADVERVVMVDIDRDLVALARKHLSSWHQGSFDDPRVRLVISDGFDFVNTNAERFDVIFIDLVDLFEGGPAERLCTRDFYRTLKNRLNDGGLLVVQAMQCDIRECRDHLRVRQNLAGLFAHMPSYATFVPSFGAGWGFVIASDAVDPETVPSDRIDRVIAARGLTERLRYYDGRQHQGLFSLPKELRARLGECS
jgi:spermidine synthase